MQSQHPLTDLLDVGEDEAVLIVTQNWAEVRVMESNDGTTVEQRREKDGEWVLTEILHPVADKWPWLTMRGKTLGLTVPMVEWLGPLDSIPDELLLSDVPLMSRRVDKQGWINLRSVIKERCEEKA